MITVKCRDVRTVMAHLAAHVAEQVGAMPALKKNEFVLVPPDDVEIEVAMVAESVKDFLRSIKQDAGFSVTASNQTVSVSSLDGKELGPVEGLSSPGFFTCQHCGRISYFEADNRDHERMHYIGGA